MEFYINNKFESEYLYNHTDNNKLINLKVFTKNTEISLEDTVKIIRKIIDIFENVSIKKSISINEYLKPIINVIIKTESEVIEEYILEKIKHLNNPKSLNLLTELSPLLLKITDIA